MRGALACPDPEKLPGKCIAVADLPPDTPGQFTFAVNKGGINGLPYLVMVVYYAGIRLVGLIIDVQVYRGIDIVYDPASFLHRVIIVVCWLQEYSFFVRAGTKKYCEQEEEAPGFHCSTPYE